MLRRGALIAGLLTAVGVPAAALEAPQWSGRLETEWAVSFEDDGAPQHRSQKLEWTLLPEMRWDLGAGTRLRALGRLRVDAFDRIEPGHPRPAEVSSLSRRGFAGDHVDFELRELTLETEWGRTWFTIGKQQIVWGQADGLKVLDVVNPQDFREFILPDFEDSRIPLWSVQAEVPVGDATLQLLWIPDPSYHELPDPGATFAFTAPRFLPPVRPGTLPRVEEPDRPRRLLADSDAGARLEGTLGGVDLTLNYLFHTDDVPVFEAEPRGGGVVAFTPRYHRTHLVGGTASGTLGDLTVRAELGWSSDKRWNVDDPRDADLVRRSSELGYVLGFDWYGIRDTLLSLQVFQSVLLRDLRGLRRDRVETNLTFLARREFLNERLRLEAIWIHNTNEQDGLVRPKLRYELRGDLAVWVGADVFYGSAEGVFGEFDERDRATVGFEWGF